MAKSLLVYGTTAAAASGTFIAPVGSGAGIANEVDTEYAATAATVFSNLRRNITSGGSGANTLQLRKNAANGNLVATGTGTGAATDLAHTDSLVNGDVFCAALTDDGSDPVYRFVTMNVALSPSHGSLTRAGSSGGTTMATAGATRFQPINGALITDGTATIATSQWLNRGYTSADAFQIRIVTNTRVDDSTVTLRVGGVTVADATITIPAGTTGLFLVTGIGRALAAGDTINAAVALGAGAGTLTVGHIGATLLSSGQHSEVWLNANAFARSASATPTYYLPAANGVSSTTAADVAITPGFAADCQNLRVRLSANTYGADATLRLMVNGVAQLTTTITAGVTGWHENTSDKISITPTDTVAMEVVGGTSGSISITAMGFTLANPTPVDPSVTNVGRKAAGMGVGGSNRNHPWPQFSRVG